MSDMADRPPTETASDEPNHAPETADIVSGPTGSQAEGGSASDGEDGLIRIRRSHLYSFLIPLAFVTGLAAGYVVWGRGSQSTPVTQPAAGQQQARFDVSTDDDPALGPPDAPITIVEFSDFNCPYCRRFRQTTFDELMAAYPDQIRFVYRDYPILSQESFLAAQAAECADEQGAFWEYHDELFSGRLELGPLAYREYATGLGLDVEGLMACVESGELADEVQADARYASGLGITGTPTFFINGIPLVGAQPLAEFTRLIEQELN